MFEYIRKHQRLVLSFLLVLILPSFIFFGVEGYSRMGDGENAVAKVAGYTITKEEWDGAQRQQLERMRQMFGNQFDASMFDTPQTKRAVLENLMSQYALSAETERAKLTVPVNILRENILRIPGLTKEDGSFDEDQYRILLASQGMTATGFQSRMARDMALQQLNGAIQLTGVTPATVAERLSDLQDQERTVQSLNFRAANYASQVKVTDEMLQSYYKDNIKTFQTPEHAKIEYIVLDRSVIESQISVTDADLQAYYDQNIQQYSTPEQRRASHILIAVPASASAADKTAAKTKAATLLAQLKANPADFAKLAKENSDDPGSAENGGDLGFFDKGLMVKSFEDAAYGLDKNQISELVESEFGFHIIKVTDIKPAIAKPFATVKNDIATTIKNQLFGKKYAELAEQFNNLVYEQGDSLKPAADQLKLTILTADNVTRQPNPAFGQLVFNNPKFLNALFTNDVIQAKHNSEVVETAPNQLIAGRIVQHTPVTTRPFDEVKALITANVTKAEEVKLAKAAGEAELAKLRAADNAGANFAQTQVVSHVKTQGWSEENFNAVMRADVSKLPAYAGVASDDEGYTIYRISKVEQPAVKDVERRKTERDQIANVLVQQEALAYLDTLKKRAKSEILKGGQVVAAPVQE
jgi:peptidyl-prolyl cis-trans isomerase D